MAAVYVDSSIVVRIVARQPRALTALSALGRPFASALVEVEVPRAIAQLWAAGALSDASTVVAAADAVAIVRRIEIVEIDPAVRLRAAGPLGGPLRTLDAIHLATALLWHEAHPDEPVVVATHDERLARAAQMHALRVVGWPD